MDVKLTMTGIGKLNAFIGVLQPASRQHLHAVGANALSEKVKRHLLSVAPSRHASATRLGAAPTRHIENAIGSVTPHADAAHGEVVIPIAGIGRAFHDIRLTTPTRNGKKYLTIPKHAAAYGHTVTELKARGWKIFRPGKKKVLLGYRQKGEKPVVLFTLAETVNQRRDPSLLPSEGEASETVVRAIAAECRRIIMNAK